MLTQDRLKQVFDYNPETGLFTRILAISRKSKVGDIVTTVNRQGYIVLRLDGELHYCHRLAWLFVHGFYPTSHIDHINGNPSDNRLCNLRDVSQKANMQNLHKPHKDSKSGFIGVHKDKKRWAARIFVNGKSVSLGSYSTPKDASTAYLAAKRIYHDGCTI